jgi:DNA-binding GntR family transcriptional regulator
MKPDKKTICYEAIKSKILTLEWGPGSYIEEVAVSKEFSLSRTPFREILQRLSGEGYVVLEKNKGALVPSMNLEMMRNFFQTAPLIYANIARLAAENGKPHDLNKLKAIQKDYRGAIEAGEPAKMVLFNHHFHQTMGGMAANAYLAPSFDRLLIDHARSSQIFYRPSQESDKARIAKSCDQHDELIEAIEKRDSEKAIAVTLAHWDLSRSFTELYVLPDPLPIKTPEAK